MTLKPTKRAMERFNYFAACNDTLREVPIPYEAGGYSALECFYAHETYGKQLPCCQPEKLARALNGKEWHGLTVTHCAEDYVGRLLFAKDLESYPEWVRRDILGRAGQIALAKLGFVPTFVKTGRDFTISKA